MKFARVVLLIISLLALELLSGSRVEDKASALAQGQQSCTFTVQPGQSVQRVIDSALPGAVICLSQGIFQGNIQINKSLTLIGMGEKRTTIKGQPPQGLQDSEPVIKISLDDPEAQVIVENLAVEGFNKSGNCLKISGKGRITSQDLSIKFCERGLWIDGNAFVVLLRTTISDSGSLLVQGAAQVHFEQSNLFRNSSLYIEGSAKVSIESCSLRDNAHGIGASGSSQVDIRNSEIANNEVGGVGVYKEAYVSIDNSQIIRNRSEGIAVSDSARLTIAHSIISENWGEGIWLSGSSQLELSNSVIQRNQGCGLWVYSKEAQVQGTPNEIWNNGADLCGYALPALRKPLIPQTDKTNLRVPGDFVNLQEAVDAIAPGGIITLAPGVYSTSLTIWKPVTIRGAGQESTRLISPSIFLGSKLSFVISIPAGVNDVILEGLTVTSSPTGLLVYGEVALNDIRISGNQRFGIRVRGSAIANLQKATISANKYAGIEVADAATVVLTDSTVSDNDNDGIVLSLGSKASLSLQRSIVSDNGSWGIDIIGHGQVTVQYSRISGNVWGLSIGPWGYRAVVRIDNSIISSNIYGLSAYGGTLNIANSQIFGNGYSGLYIGNQTKAEVRQSAIESNGSNEQCYRETQLCNGITISGEAQLKLIDSVIRNNPDWGLSAVLKKCGYKDDFFTGQVVFNGINTIESNNTSGNQKDKGNPGNHPWNHPDRPDGQVCLP